MNNQTIDKSEEDEDVDHQLTVNSLSGLLPPIVQRVDTKGNKQKTKKPPKTKVDSLRIFHRCFYFIFKNFFPLLL